jgi:predicted RNase H-related nuclease YkuK (DUF458 family)
MSEQVKDYVVVTRARLRKSGRFITHVYGLYTQNKAKSVKSNIKREAEASGEEVEVSACHIIDIDRMNRELISTTLREAIQNA